MRLLSLVLILFSVSCVSKIQTKQIFSLSEVESYKKEGTATVKGQLFSRTNSGDVKSGAGVAVNLIPMTPYFIERAEIIYKKCATTDPLNEKAKKYVRTVLADLQGNYIFEKVPTGKYFVNSILTWNVASQYGLVATGSRKLAEIEVKDGETINVNLTDNCVR
mgnify:CR=1 FL=1